MEATKPAPQPQVAPEASQTPAVDTRRKKQARPDKKRDDFDREEDGPRKQQKNRSSQNQVRNQKNSNWNHNKKNKKGKNNRNNNQTPKPVTERKFHELPKEFEYTEGMTVAEIAKRIKREPAEIVKKLFMMGVMATQNQSLDGDTIELLMVDYGIEAHAKVEVDNADIDRFFVDDDYLDPDALVERPLWDTLTTGKQRFWIPCVILVLPQVKQVVLHNISVLTRLKKMVRKLLS